ncbi:hypothetical protein FC40_GL001452 [Ligilactobacillus hayakitensis DSM 18933 = JCM 14209]|uniref:DUF4044 domain-containing protein n=1 Tax=Ligilactobacillus hayakitensis DSM 18933 = JCM 14209 TaxID=1423755 RepID=A0A0R1WTY4_9LACO|nr:hypothetical protein [Ligilactobacillus hayakitensis]KRM19604.1 hypothetical protein FC40_GL001452 [Ligilactobacillus hayakitensis DSM 18933 = JCM 14209]
MTKENKDLLAQSIENRLQEAKHEYRKKKDPRDYGKIVLVIVMMVIVLGMIIQTLNVIMN